MELINQSILKKLTVRQVLSTIVVINLPKLWGIHNSLAESCQRVVRLLGSKNSFCEFRNLDASRGRSCQKPVFNRGTDFTPKWTIKTDAYKLCSFLLRAVLSRILLENRHVRSRKTPAGGPDNG